MRRHIPTLVSLLVALAPAPTLAAEIARGFTTFDVMAGEYGDTVNVSFVLMGPAEGPLKVTLRRGRRVAHREEVSIAPVPRGESRPVNVSFQTDGNLAGNWRLQVDGPKGRVGVVDTSLRRGPDREVFLGDERENQATWYELRDRFAGYGWIDDGGEHLAVELFLVAGGTGETATLTCKRGKKVVGTDEVPVSGARGQVVRVRGYCKKGGEDAEAEAGTRSLGDGVFIDADTRPDTYAQPTEGIDIDVDAEQLEGALTLKEALARPGRWRIEVRTGKRLRRVVSFAVKGGKVVPGLRRAGPMVPVSVKVVSR